MDLLTSAEVMATFGVASRTLRRWTRAGYLNPIRNPGGGHLRYQTEEVDRLASYVHRKDLWNKS